jgi:hypothetical protein
MQSQVQLQRHPAAISGEEIARLDELIDSPEETRS